MTTTSKNHEYRMRVTSKGRVTIPIAIRDQFGIKPNTEIRFIVRKGHVMLEKASGRGPIKRQSNQGDAIVARLRKTARRTALSTMTTEELMALTRGE